MTIYHYDKFASLDLQTTHFTSSEPDSIGIEYSLRGNALFSLQVGADGIVSILFDEIENAEVNLSDLRLLLEQGESELLAWHRRVDWYPNEGSKPE